MEWEKIEDIAWSLHKSKMIKKYEHSYTVKTKHIHSFLSSVKRIYNTKQRFFHCNWFKNNITLHNHHLQCNKSTKPKKELNQSHRQNFNHHKNSTINHRFNYHWYSSILFRIRLNRDNIIHQFTISSYKLSECSRLGQLCTL